LPKYTTPVFISLLMGFSLAQLATAQSSSVAHLAVASGNGQVACICISATLQAFQPISVKATDVNGNPVPGATVTWTVTSGQLIFGNSATTATSTTDGTGTATQSISLTVFSNYSSSAVPYIINTAQATTNGNSVTFTETQSLVTSLGSSLIGANPPQYNGQALEGTTLSAPVGTTLTTAIQTQVVGTGQAANGVANASVSILNNQASPSLSCAYQGGYADPGSVLSDQSGNTNCYPVFSGSGSGTFYILIGGVPGTSFSTALYLQAFGPFSFTSVPGAPASVQIVSGNNQVGGIGTQLNPLVAKLVDGSGNPVQGQTMVWSVVPAGAVALSTGPFVTDNNGQVSITVTLDILASAGAAITVALQSNPNISATFQETVQGAITAMNKISGDKQTAQENTSFASPLVVQLMNASGPVANYPVQFQVSGPVSLSSATVGTNANGDASVNVLAGTVAGTATVTAVAGALTQNFTLTVSSTPTGPAPNGIVVVSGNNQSAIESAQFSQPLVVQVNSTAGPVSGVTVSFSTTGPLSLSSSSQVTNSSGQATINVTAGATTGAGTVVAAITGYTATFNLNVTPPGPQITASSFVNAASGQSGANAMSPCSLAILSAPGLTPDGTTDYTLAPIFGRYPKAVHNLSVTFGGIAAPIVSVAMGATNPQVTLQVPCEVTPGSSVPVVVNVNGGGTATVNVAISNVSPGIFQQVMSDGTSRAVAVRSDGSFADIGGTDQYDPTNPVRLNEVARFYVTGLGPTNPSVGSDTIEDPNSYIYNVESDVTGTVSIGFAGSGVVVNNLVAHLAPGLIGVYEVDVPIPSNAPTGNNVPIYIAIVPAGSASGTTPIQSANSTIPIGQ
jgi:uncharacterized protein (TIGR03437 family)